MGTVPPPHPPSPTGSEDPGRLCKGSYRMGTIDLPTTFLLDVADLLCGSHGMALAKKCLDRLETMMQAGH